MIKPHITPGINGYTTTAGKQIKAINAKARAALAEKKSKPRLYSINYLKNML